MNESKVFCAYYENIEGLTEGNSVTIKGFKVIEGINGLFISPPSQKGKDDEYYDTVFIAPELREELNHTAIQQYGMMEDSSSDNFDFPASKNIESEITSPSTPEPVNSTTEQSSDPMPSADSTKKEDESTFSDDDIPF